MLEDAAAIRKVVIACGYVDLRKGIDGLSMIIGDRYRQNPFEKGTLFLFCGRRSDRIKGLLWMGNGFLLLYKRLESGSLSWPRTSEEAAELTEEQFQYLMLGINPLNPKIKDVTPQQPGCSLCKKLKFPGLFSGFSDRTGKPSILRRKGCYNPCVQAYPLSPFLCA